MKKALYLSITLCISICCLTFSSCNNTSDVVARKRFPSTFLQAGSDNDHSYVSLKSYRLDNDYLKLELTGWGIKEFGIFLQDYVKDDALVLNILGECGTGVEPPVVIEKRTFTYTVSTALEDQLNVIQLRTIELGKE